VESDVIISGDFPIKELQSNSGALSFPIVSQDRGIASVLYSPNSESLTHLVKHCLSYVQREPFGTDMLFLRSYFDLFPERVRVFGIMPMSKEFPLTGNDSNFVQSQWQSFATFGGLFDGAKVGYYFFGSNPWNKRGISFLRRNLESCYFDLEKASLIQNKNRNFFDIRLNGKVFPMFCLHCTCKNPRLFHVRTLLTSGEQLLKLVNKKLYWKVTIQMLVRKIHRFLNDMALGRSNNRGEKRSLSDQ
jgi:hypothetical protein